MMRLIGGFLPHTVGAPLPLPAGARPHFADGRLWELGKPGILPLTAARAGRRLLAVIGTCGASPAELVQLAARGVDPEAVHAWPGAYALVQYDEDRLALFTDLASAVPLYTAVTPNGTAWCTSSRALAALTGAGIDQAWLAAGLLLPGQPAAREGKSAFTEVQHVPAGHRADLAPGRPVRWTRTWTPRPDAPLDAAGHRLGTALRAAVAARVTGTGTCTADLSGGMDSTTIALLAACELHPVGGRITATTLHPASVTTGGDLDYAAAVVAPGLVAHRIPLTDAHLSHTPAPAPLPALDEPAPATGTQACFTHHLRALRDAFDSRCHLTGDGGDSLLCPPLQYLPDLIRHRALRRAAAHCAGWADLHEGSPTALWRAALCAARHDRPTALEHAARSVLGEARGASPLDWYGAPTPPPWATGPAAELAAGQLRMAAAGPQPNGRDAAAWLTWEQITEVGRTAAADAHLAYAVAGVPLHNPFTDSAVVAAALSTALHEIATPYAYKPLLPRALPGLLPPAVACRRTKGDSTADFIRGFRANLGDLLDLADGRLAARGLIDPGALRDELHLCAAGLSLPAALDPALSTELWLRSLDQAPAIRWTTVRPSAARPQETVR